MRKLPALALLVGTGSLLSTCRDRDTAAPCDCPDIGGPAKWSLFLNRPFPTPTCLTISPATTPPTHGSWCTGAAAGTS